MAQPLEQYSESISDLQVVGIPVRSMRRDDGEDATLLRGMLVTAETYLRSFSWCGHILSSFFGGGVGGVLAVFLFKIQPDRPDVGSWIWVVVGDIPSACLPLEGCASPADVFERYTRGIGKWVELARAGRRATAEDGVPPINLPATPEWADKLERSLQLVTLKVKPLFDEVEEPAPVC